MKKYLLMAAASLVMMPVAAQETYENAKLVQEDLNGTARYVGMGGAMEALGADISTIGTNPAGVGLFRHSMINGSFGFVSQGDAPSYASGDKSHMSFDQIGFVWARSGEGGTLNLSFNYHKSKNFDYILSAAAGLGNAASQNAQSFIKMIAADQNGASYYNVTNTRQGIMGNDVSTSQIDNMYYNNFLFDTSATFDSKGWPSGGWPGYNFASDYLMNREHTGYIGEYDFNISGSTSDRLFLGLTFGIKDVHYKAFGSYSENLVNAQNAAIGRITVNDDRRITGTGFDVKAGVIFRPVESSPFRVGLYVHTPTWYDLTTENFTTMVNATDIHGYNNGWTGNESYDFKLYTPWKFGLSLGHTIGSKVALGATYEFADYAHLDTRVNDGGYYDYYYDDYYETSSSDRDMNDHTKRTLKGVSTLKLGAEYKPVPEVAFRIGYNYVSPMYKEEGFKDPSVDSYGSNYATATDYTNWKSTNRLTLGVGYNLGKLSLDLAYQFSGQKGDFKPFTDSWADFNYINASGQLTKDFSVENYVDKVEVKNNRHQLLMTLGYHF